MEIANIVTIFKLIITNILIILKSTRSIVIRQNIVTNRFCRGELSIIWSQIIIKVKDTYLRSCNIVKNDVWICYRRNSVKEKTEEIRTFRNLKRSRISFSDRIFIRLRSYNFDNNSRLQTNDCVTILNAVKTRCGLISTNGLTKSHCVSDRDFSLVDRSIFKMTLCSSVINTSDNLKSGCFGSLCYRDNLK